MEEIGIPDKLDVSWFLTKVWWPLPKDLVAETTSVLQSGADFTERWVGLKVIYL